MSIPSIIVNLLSPPGLKLYYYAAIVVAVIAVVAKLNAMRLFESAMQLLC